MPIEAVVRDERDGPAVTRRQVVSMRYHRPTRVSQADGAVESSGGECAVKITIFQIKLVHTVIFWILSACVVFTLVSGVTGRLSTWTWVAVGLLAVESVVLTAAGWVSPLTILAERQGATQGSVADLFLPKWAADRIFPVCGTAYGIGLALIAWRLWW